MPDGEQVVIRPIRKADAALLADGFDRLSAQSRWFRFLTAKKILSPAELRYFTDIDHDDHEALGAFSVADGRVVGVARYIRRTEDPMAADVAVTVADDWQRHGIATQLLTRLTARAVEAGVCRYTVQIAAENLAVLGLIRGIGLGFRSAHVGFGTLDVQIALPLRVSAASR